ncbi:MAG: amidohydrolase family protein [Gemmatimonadota bacterium]|nr:amidohydrolase family protein [Gemmatimonadota bacterium]
MTDCHSIPRKGRGKVGWALVAAAVLGLPPGPAAGQVDPLLGDSYDRLVIRGATIIDGTGGPPQGPRDVVVAGGRIVEITRAGGGTGDRIIEAEGRYVMPGIIDAHTHLGDDDVPPDYIPKLWLAHGVTTVRVFSGSGLEDLAVRLATAQRSGNAPFDAPQVVVYPFWRGEDARFWDPEGAREVVREWAQMGHDGIKISGKPGLLPDILPVIADEARTLGMGVAVHIGQDGVYPMNAVAVAATGVTTIEHHYGYPEATFADRGMQDLAADHDYGDELKRFRSTGRVWDDTDMDRLYGPVMDTLLELSREGHFTMVPTFSVYEDQTDLSRAKTLPWLERYTWPSVMERWTPNPEVHGSFYFEWTSADEAAWSRLFIRWLPWVNDFKNRGGRVAVGSDSGTSYHLYGFGTIRELELMQRAGFHPLEIVRSATQESARAVGLPDVGVIRPGYQADLLVLDANPLEDFKVLYGTGASRSTPAGEASVVQGLRYTILDGKVIDAQAVLEEVAAMVARAKRASS